MKRKKKKKIKVRHITSNARFVVQLCACAIMFQDQVNMVLPMENLCKAMNKCSLSKGASDSKMKQFVFAFLSSLPLFNDSQNALENDKRTQLSEV